MSLEKLITISSDDKDPDSVSNSNFWVSLKETYYTQNIIRILIKEATVPNCFYNLSNGLNNGKQNNVLNYVDENKINKSFEITPGQYNIDQFIAALIAGFNSNGDALTITQDELTQKLIFTFPFYKNIFSSSSISPVLGITDDLKCQPGVPTYSYFPPDLSGINAVNIHSSIMAEGNGVDGNFGIINLLERVSLHDIPFGSFGYKQNNDSDLATISYAQPKNLNRIDIRLRDTQGNVLNIGTKKMSIILKVYFA